MAGNRWELVSDAAARPEGDACRLRLLGVLLVFGVVVLGAWLGMSLSTPAAHSLDLGPAAPVVAPVTNTVGAVAAPVTRTVATVTTPAPTSSVDAPTVSTPSPVDNTTAPASGALAAVTAPLAPVLSSVTAPLAPVLTAVTAPVAPIVSAVTAPLAPVLTAGAGSLTPVVAALAAPLVPVVTAVAAPVATAPPPSTVTAPATLTSSEGRPVLPPAPDASGGASPAATLIPIPIAAHAIGTEASSPAAADRSTRPPATTSRRAHPGFDAHAPLPTSPGAPEAPVGPTSPFSPSSGDSTAHHADGPGPLLGALPDQISPPALQGRRLGLLGASRPSTWIDLLLESPG